MRRRAPVLLVLGLTLSGCKSNDVVQTCDPPKVGSGASCKCPSGTLEPDCRVDCATTNVYNDAGGIDASTIVYDDFSVPDSGRLDVTLDWTDPASRIGFYLVPANTCTTLAEFNARSCNFLVRSEPSSTKPRKISTANFSAGNYRWLVANFASQQESVSFQIVLNKGTGCAPLAGGAPAAAALSGTAPQAAGLHRR